MQAWWRVLRGVVPYKWSVILSMLCALGVGLTYASGVTVMYPVTKIFLSDEQLQGWANHVAAQSRLGVDIADLDRGATELVVTKVGEKASPNLSSIPVRFIITRVQVDGQQEVGGPKADDWQDMMRVLSHAPKNAKVTLGVLPKGGQEKAVQVVLRDASAQYAALMWAVGLLPNDRPMTAFMGVVSFFVLLCIIGSVLRYYQQFLGMTVANRVIMDLRRRAYDRIVQLPTSFFARRGTADAMSRLSQDAGTLTDGVSMAFGKAVQEPVKAIFSFGAALYVNWKLTLMISVSAPILGLIIRLFSRHMRKASRKALENSSSILGIINETLIAMKVVKAYTAEGYERRRFTLANKKLLKQQVKWNHYNAMSRPFVETMAIVLMSVPVMIAANWVLTGVIKKEDVLTLLILFAAMLEPMRKLADVNAKVQQTNAAATRVFEIVDMEKEPNTSHTLPKLPRHKTLIEFRDVVFSYPGHQEIVLNHINATVRAGQNVAVVGGNGSGKTTLVHLLPRLYVPTSGQVLIDGVDTATVSLRSLRKQIGLVTQDTLLFADTLYNNIAYGTRHASREQVLDASRRAFADEFIQTFPEGYETRVGEHGVRLSGGQKQRIAIARAILRDPAILILDEAMSQVDSDSEMKITKALREFTRGRTTFQIAHRFQSVITADMIICLDKGSVAGIGTHQELLASCAPYKKLYEIQFHEGAYGGEEAASPNGEEALVQPAAEGS
jgi:ATP-binding cassette, subfamily B, bacterial MsbA